MARECECPTEHTIAKLGHCATCPFAGKPRPRLPEVALRSGCPPEHADGSRHDFDWATYADDLDSDGVCRCGLRSTDYSLMTGALP